MLKSRIFLSVLIFISSFSVLLFLKPILVPLTENYVIASSSFFLDSWVNEEFTSKKYAHIKSAGNDFVRVSCIFYNADGSAIERYVLIDVFSEFALPMILTVCLALIFAYYLKLKYHFIINTFILGAIVFTMKFVAIIFDNYNYREYRLCEFSFPIKQIIFYFNKLLNITGSSLNFIMPIVLILIIVGIYHKSVSKKLN